MPDQAKRIDRAVDLLLRGGRVKPSAGLGPDRDALMAAATLAGARVAYPRMTPEFRQRLARRIAGDPDQRLLSRRAALAAAAGLAAGALGAAGLDRVAFRPQPAPPRTLPGGWVRVASLAEIPATAPLRVLAGSAVAYLFRSDDAVRSVSALCSDQPCALDWQRVDGELYCPCHRVEFTSDGKPLGAAAAKYGVPPLSAYPVKVVAGEVYLQPKAAN